MIFKRGDFIIRKHSNRPADPRKDELFMIAQDAKKGDWIRVIIFGSKGESYKGKEYYLGYTGWSAIRITKIMYNDDIDEKATIAEKAKMKKALFDNMQTRRVIILKIFGDHKQAPKGYDK